MRDDGLPAATQAVRIGELVCSPMVSGARLSALLGSLTALLGGVAGAALSSISGAAGAAGLEERVTGGVLPSASQAVKGGVDCPERLGAGLLDLSVVMPGAPGRSLQWSGAGVSAEAMVAASQLRGESEGGLTVSTGWMVAGAGSGVSAAMQQMGGS